MHSWSATSPTPALATALLDRRASRRRAIDGRPFRFGPRGRSRRARLGSRRRGRGDREARFMVPGEPRGPTKEREQRAEADDEVLLGDPEQRRDDVVDVEPGRQEL